MHPWLRQAQCSIADAELKYIPIIVLTGLARQGDEAHCLEAGANDYLSKPVSLKKLVGMIEAQLRASPPRPQ